MTNVIAWPPFSLTGWEIFDNYPQSRSTNFFQGNARTSSAQVARREVTAIASGIGSDLAGSGYVRMLNRQWGHGPKLVRVKCRSALWHLSAAGAELQASLMSWTSGGGELQWTTGGGDLLWATGAGSGQYGTYNNGGTWPKLTITGLPANRVIARPADRVRVMDGETVQEQLVMGIAQSNGSGTATVYFEKPFTINGLVSIGVEEEMVLEVLATPRAVQPVGANYGYTFEAREVFASEYADGFTEVTPPWLSN